MADAGLVRESCEQLRTVSNISANMAMTDSPALLKGLIDDDTYKILQRHFHMMGKGRRPDLPIDMTLTNGLLMQLYFLKEEAKSTFVELKMWLEQLLPGTSHISDSRIHHRINTIIGLCSSLPQDQATILLQKEYDFDALPPVLASLGLNRQSLNHPETFCQPPLDNLSNEVVIALARENKSPAFMRQWLSKLSVACKGLSDRKLRTLISKTIKKNQQLTKNKNRKGNERDEFLKSSFFEVNLVVQENQHHEPTQTICRPCIHKDKIIKGHESALKKKEGFIRSLQHDKRGLDTELKIKDEVIAEIQKEKRELLTEIRKVKSSADDVPILRKQIKTLEKDINDLRNSKLYYRRNLELKEERDGLLIKIKTLEQELWEEQNADAVLRKKIKLEPDMY